MEARTNNQNILITGGLGNIGSWLVEYFSKSGNTVYALSQSQSLQLNSSINYVQADITSPELLENALRDISVDYCIHTASVNDTFIEGYELKSLMANAYGTRNLIAALLPKKIKKFVYFSTFHVYGASEGLVNEDLLPAPRHDYATTHLFAEYYLKQFYNSHKFPYTTIRLTNGYGAPKNINSTKWYLLLNDLARMAYEKGAIVLKSNGQASRDFIWLGDVCEIVDKLMMSLNTDNQLYNVASEQSFRILDIATTVQQAYSDRYGKTIAITLNEQDVTVASNNLFVSCEKLRSVISYDIRNKFYEEVNHIFDLLEGHSRSES